MKGFWLSPEITTDYSTSVSESTKLKTNTGSNIEPQTLISYIQTSSFGPVSSVWIWHSGLTAVSEWYSPFMAFYVSLTVVWETTEFFPLCEKFLAPKVAMFVKQPFPHISVFLQVYLLQMYSALFQFFGFWYPSPKCWGMLRNSAFWAFSKPYLHNQIYSY